MFTMWMESKGSEQMLKSKLQQSGFDIVHPFSFDALDDSVLEYLPIKNLSGKMGFLVGNTGSIWDDFIEWLSQRLRWSEIVDPFETFIEETIERCVGQKTLIFWTHETKRYIIPVQRMAHQTGLAYLSDGQFNIHPRFGPWFALRAVVIVSGTMSSNQVIPNPSTEDIETTSKAMFNRLLQSNATWQEWLSLRDLYIVGRTHRYSEEQIRYHYTRDKTVLLQEMDRLRTKIQ